jgi:LuxR family maltose regulon positive regulatory protein
VSTPVLATKLFAPTRRPGLVARPELVARLDATLEAGHRLTLVSAPAGFGKTTLLSDWISHLEQRASRTRVGWLALDAGDDDLTRLLTHLVAALDNAGLETPGRLLDPMDTGSSAEVLTALVNQVTRASEQSPQTQWVLVLDDYHVIAAPEVHDAVTFLLDHLPDRVHLVMATRSDPPGPLARLRSRGQLTEVRATDLRFTPDEARDFLNRMMGLDLTASDVDALEERTEGWVAGLQLAALSLRGIPERGEVAGFIEAFAGSNRFVIDYLADEVLARQPDEVRDFLLRTGVLDRLTGSLCDAVTGRADGARMLEDLERGNLFLVSLDTRRVWYRYHHLFADVLRARLLAERADQVPELHQRASDWYAAHDLVEDAVRHALAAEDFRRAAYLMEEALPGLTRGRQDTLLLGWVRSLPGSVVRSSPVLSVLSAWSMLLTGDLDAVEHRLDDAEAALAAGARDPDLAAGWADTETLRTAAATIAVYRASLAQARGDVAGTVRQARRALDLARPEDHLVRGSGWGFLGLAAWSAGNVHEALSTFSDAVRSLHAAGNLVDELDSTVVLADMWVASGRPARARSLFEQALRTATGGGPPFPRATADLHVGLAELDRELDELASAAEHLETARALAERGSITENRHRWFVAMAQLRAAGGDVDAALGLLDEAERLYRRGFYPEVRPIAAMRARLEIGRGDLTSATAWARDVGVDADEDPDYLREYEHLTLVRLMLARRLTEQDQPAAALGLLGRLHGAATHVGRDGSLQEIRMLQALAHQALDDQPRALAALAEAFAGAPEPESYVRLYLDEGPPMLELLQRAARVETLAVLPGQEGESLHRHARRLLGRVGATTGSGETPQALVDPLSQRELEVLRLLGGDLTGPQIAKELFVSLNTLRTHTKRIFTKLEVTTRVAAVRRARDLGLL